MFRIKVEKFRPYFQTYMRTYVWTWNWTTWCTCVRTCVRAYVRVSARVCVRASVRACVCARARACLHMPHAHAIAFVLANLQGFLVLESAKRFFFAIHFKAFKFQSNCRASQTQPEDDQRVTDDWPCGVGSSRGFSSAQPTLSSVGRVWLAVPMATPIAPPPPEGFPAGYLALRCQFCLSWSSDLAPYAPKNKATDAWWPLIPWLAGKRENPKGLVRLVCANVSWRSEHVASEIYCKPIPLSFQ